MQFQASSRQTYLSPGHGGHGGRSQSPSDIAAGMSGLNIDNPQTPDRNHPNTRSRANPPAPGAPSTVRHHIVRGEESRRQGDTPGIDVLLDVLEHCPKGPDYKAKLNAAAERAGYHHIPWEVLPWKLRRWHREHYAANSNPMHHHAQSLEHKMVQAVVNNRDEFRAKRIEEWPELVRIGQIKRNLMLEADVSDSVLSNVLNPLCELLNGFIRADEPYNHLQCTIRSQHSFNSSFLDHAIFLTESVASHRGDYGLQIPLVIVEHKAPGIVRPRDWRHETSQAHDTEDRMHTLLPQLLLYAQKLQCSRFFVTDYTSTFGVRFDLPSLQAADDDLKKNRNKRCSHPVTIQVRDAEGDYEHRPRARSEHAEPHPYDYGFRFALALEVYSALFQLGVADTKLLELHTSEEDIPPVSERIATFLKNFITRPTATQSASPSHGRGHHLSPPPSPSTLHAHLT